MFRSLSIKIQELRNFWALAVSKQELIMVEFNDGKRVHVPIKQCQRKIEWDFKPTYIALKETYLWGDARKDSSTVFALPNGMIFDLQGQLH